MDSFEEIGVNFPDMSKYQINKLGDMALYSAHCDLYPFRSVQVELIRLLVIRLC